MHRSQNEAWLNSVRSILAHVFVPLWKTSLLFTFTVKGNIIHNIEFHDAINSSFIVFHPKLLQQHWQFIGQLVSICKKVLRLLCCFCVFVGSGSFSLSGSADLFLGVPPVNGEQSAYQMGMQVLYPTYTFLLPRILTRVPNVNNLGVGGISV